MQTIDEYPKTSHVRSNAGLVVWYRDPVIRAKVFLCVLLLASGASSASAQSGEYRGYTVGVGDTIAVEAFQLEEISGEFLVEEGGAISFPLIGSLLVAGRTTLEISRQLEQLLEKDFYVDVQLQVEVEDYHSQPVFIVGEVQRPGTYYLQGRTTLTAILGEAGGPRPTAGTVLELRRNVVENGEPTQQVYTFSITKLNRGEEGVNVEVRQGDVISVPAKQLYFVTGEVARPGQYELAPGMTLLQAISQAGGLAKFASHTVEVHREQNEQNETTVVDISDIRKGKVPDPQIMSGDVILVRKRFF